MSSLHLPPCFLPNQNPKPFPFPFPFSFSAPRPTRIRCGIRELRDRIHSVKSTQKITEAMKFVAAARVRRAQEAALNSRPFSESLLRTLHVINQRAQFDFIDVPLTQTRPVKKVALVVVSGDRGLCGGFNSTVIKKAESRIEQLNNLGLELVVISVGKKGNSYFSRRPGIEVECIVEENPMQNPHAQGVIDVVFSLFVSEEVDKVELIYTKFVSLLRSEAVIQTLLPLSREGEVFDVEGNCVDALGDEYFRLTSKEGRLAVVREGRGKEGAELEPLMEFEQDPVQILGDLMPLYLNSQIVRALQESLASELASRMTAMSSATDNAVELSSNLKVAYNRARQGKITGELLEIVAGAEALRDS